MVRVPAPRVHEEEARHEKKTWHCKSADLIENPELLTYSQQEHCGFTSEMRHVY
jgi:hypothetical protein